MDDMLSWKDSYEPLKHLGVKPTDMKTDSWKIIIRKAVGLIRQCIEQEVFHYVAQETNTQHNGRNKATSVICNEKCS